MYKVVLGLGSNLGNREDYLKRGLFYLRRFIKDMKISNIYVSRAFGFEKQPEFYNMAVLGYTDLPPFTLLDRIKQVERAVGRRERFRWGPREIDIDIIFYDWLVMETERLIIPHRHSHIRDFVLLPVYQLQPDLIHPKELKSIKQLLQSTPYRTVHKVIHR